MRRPVWGVLVGLSGEVQPGVFLVAHSEYAKISASLSNSGYANAPQRCTIKSDTKKWELLKNPTKIEEIQEKKFIDRN